MLYLCPVSIILAHYTIPAAPESIAHPRPMCGPANSIACVLLPYSVRWSVHNDRLDHIEPILIVFQSGYSISPYIYHLVSAATLLHLRLRWLYSITSIPRYADTITSYFHRHLYLFKSWLYRITSIPCTDTITLIFSQVCSYIQIMALQD